MKEISNPMFPLSLVTLPRGSLHRDGQGLGTAPPAKTGAGIRVAWARHQNEVRQAQRLRFDVFAGEMGARLQTPLPGHDVRPRLPLPVDALDWGRDAHRV